MQSDAGGVKRNGYKVSSSEYATLHNDASTLFICLSIIYISLQFLYHEEYIIK